MKAVLKLAFVATLLGCSSNEELFERIVAGDAEAIRSGYYNVDKAGPSGMLPLQFAIKRADRRVFDALIDAGADVNKSKGSLGTPMHSAATVADPYFVHRLRRHGGDPNRLNDTFPEQQMAPLHFCATSGSTASVETVMALVDSGADMSGQPAFCGCPATFYVVASREDLALALLRRGAPYNQSFEGEPVADGTGRFVTIPKMMQGMIESVENEVYPNAKLSRSHIDLIRFLQEDGVQFTIQSESILE